LFEYSELSNVMFYVFYRWANMLFKLFWRPCFFFKNFTLFILFLFLGVFRLSNASLILSCSIFSFSILYFSFWTIYAFSKNSLYSWPFINCSARLLKLASSYSYKSNSAIMDGFSLIYLTVLNLKMSV
jgi:hypothetical protein